MRSTDIIQVQIVGGHWWDTVLPVVSIIISFGTLLYYLVSRHADGARLKVVATSFMTLPSWPGMPHRWYVGVEVTNIGRTGTTVLNSVVFETPKGVGLHQVVPPVPDQGFPRSLGPGGSYTHVFELALLVDACIEHDVKPSKLVPMASSGHGRAKGKWSKAGLKLVEPSYDAKKRRAVT